MLWEIQKNTFFGANCQKVWQYFLEKINKFWVFFLSERVWKNPKTTFGLIGASCMNGKNCRKYFIPIPTFPIQSFHWTECQKCLNMKMKFNSYGLDLFTISYLFTFCYNHLFVYILFQLADEIWFLCNPLIVVIL